MEIINSVWAWVLNYPMETTVILAFILVAGYSLSGDEHDGGNIFNEGLYD